MCVRTGVKIPKARKEGFRVEKEKNTFPTTPEKGLLGKKAPFIATASASYRIEKHPKPENRRKIGKK